jgi:hypothetical protein
MFEVNVLKSMLIPSGKMKIPYRYKIPVNLRMRSAAGCDDDPGAGFRSKNECAYGFTDKV